MCGRPKRACQRMLKSLPKEVRRTNKSRKIKDASDLRRLVLNDEDEILNITRDHTFLVGIAEASLKAVQCRAVGDCLRKIWRKDGRPISPEELPTVLLSIESQCWAKVAQFYRLRGKESAIWAEDSAKMAVSVREIQFGGWTDKTGTLIYIYIYILIITVAIFHLLLKCHVGALKGAQHMMMKENGQKMKGCVKLSSFYLANLTHRHNAPPAFFTSLSRILTRASSRPPYLQRPPIPLHISASSCPHDFMREIWTQGLENCFEDSV